MLFSALPIGRADATRCNYRLSHQHQVYRFTRKHNRQIPFTRRSSSSNVIPMGGSLPIIIWLTSLISFKFVWGDNVLKNIDAARRSLATVSEAHRKGGGTHFETQRTLNPTMIKIEPQCAGCPRRPGQEATAPDSHVQGSWRGWFW